MNKNETKMKLSFKHKPHRITKLQQTVKWIQLPSTSRFTFLIVPRVMWNLVSHLINFPIVSFDSLHGWVFNTLDFKNHQTKMNWSWNQMWDERIMWRFDFTSITHSLVYVNEFFVWGIKIWIQICKDGGKVLSSTWTVLGILLPTLINQSINQES